jgi:hypothetical protein
VRRVRRAWGRWSRSIRVRGHTYEFKPDAGIKYSKIVALADDLALALEAESIRVDRMSGRGTVGIEIPNEVREMISLREILEGDAFRKASGRLTLALGKTVGGEPTSRTSRPCPTSSSRAPPAPARAWASTA